MTDKDRVLAFFRNSQGRRIFMREIIDGLRIVEYTGRITDARKLINCTCGEDPTLCTSQEHIRNVAKGWYQYSDSRPQVKPEPIIDTTPVFDYTAKRQELIEKYREAKRELEATTDIARRKQLETDLKLIEAQGKLLKRSRPNETQSNLFKQAQEVIL